MQTAPYDSFAAAYAADNESNFVNGHYERPAMIDLAGDVKGRRVLDAGCGSGPLAAALIEGGADVVGFDLSPEMLEIARQRLGAEVDLRVADLGEPLPYPDDSFDDVIGSLVLHYLEDWTAPLAELHRVLKPGGRLILSLNHPYAYMLNHPKADYFATTEFSDEFTFAGQEATLTYWHRLLPAITSAFTEAGFDIASVSEPPYDPDTPLELIPPPLVGRSFICFMFFVLEARP